MNRRIKIIDEKLIRDLLVLAKKSPRKRIAYPLHEFNPDGLTSSEKIQRVVNVILQSSYVPPHRHLNPPKKEIFIGLYGKLVAVCFNDRGEVIKVLPFGNKEKTRAIEMNPLVWHSMVAWTPQAAMLEIIEGPYDPKTHKELASWAPSEEMEEAIIYLENLKEKIKKFLKK